MEHCMKEVLVRTNPEDSFTLVVSDSSANIQTTINSPLYRQANRTIHSQIFERVITIHSIGMLMVARLGQFSTYLQDVMN